MANWYEWSVLEVTDTDLVCVGTGYTPALREHNRALRICVSLTGDDINQDIADSAKDEHWVSMTPACAKELYELLGTLKHLWEHQTRVEMSNGEPNETVMVDLSVGDKVTFYDEEYDETVKTHGTVIDIYPPASPGHEWRGLLIEDERGKLHKGLASSYIQKVEAKAPHNPADLLTPCCDNEERDWNGWCKNCGTPGF